MIVCVFDVLFCQQSSFEEPTLHSTPCVEWGPVVQIWWVCIHVICGGHESWSTRLSWDNMVKMNEDCRQA